MVADYLRAAGVRVELGTRVSSVSRPHVNDAGYGVPHGGEVTVTLNNGQVIVADEIVVAAGRRPNSTGIGLASVGLRGGRLRHRRRPPDRDAACRANGCTPSATSTAGRC